MIGLAISLANSEFVWRLPDRTRRGVRRILRPLIARHPKNAGYRATRKAIAHRKVGAP